MKTEPEQVLVVEDDPVARALLTRIVKIDRSFVARMTHSPENLEIVRTIVRLARNLDLELVAEGVETEAQLEELRSLECESAQGYLFGRPVDVEGAEAVLQEARIKADVREKV